MLEKLMIFLFLLIGAYLFFTRVELESARAKLAFYKEASEKLQTIEAAQKRQIEQLAHELESKFKEIEKNEEDHINRFSLSIERLRKCPKELPSSQGDEAATTTQEANEKAPGSNVDRRAAAEIGRVLQECRRTNEQLILLQKYVSDHVL